jgi:hypothetical protein
VPKIILPWRYFRSELSEFPLDDFFVFRLSRQEITENLLSGYVGELADVNRMITLTPSGVRAFRENKFLTVSTPDNEYSPTELRHTIICRYENFPLRIVSKLTKSFKQSLKLRAMRTVSQSLHILENERFWLRLTYYPYVFI